MPVKSIIKIYFRQRPARMCLLYIKANMLELRTFLEKKALYREPIQCRCFYYFYPEAVAEFT